MSFPAPVHGLSLPDPRPARAPTMSPHRSRPCSVPVGALARSGAFATVRPGTDPLLLSDPARRAVIQTPIDPIRSPDPPCDLYSPSRTPAMPTQRPSVPLSGYTSQGHPPSADRAAASTAEGPAALPTPASAPVRPPSPLREPPRR